MISVVVPAFNEENYIRNCLHSLLNQDYTGSFEIIVVNNNSSDSTKELALSLGVKVVDEPRQGLSYAKNTGVRNALGDVLCFIDADSVAPKNHLSTIVNILINNSELEAFGGPHMYLDGGELVKFFTGTLRYFYYYHKFIKILFGFQSISGGNMIVKKDTFEKIGGFNENISNVVLPEDLDFCLRLAHAGSQVAIFKELLVTSSFRRYSGKPKKDGFIRISAAMRMLMKNRINP